MKECRCYIFPIIVSRLVLQLDRDTSRAHIVLVRVIIPLFGNPQGCTSINVSECAEIQRIALSCIRSPSVYIMPTGRAVEVLQFSSGFPNVRTSVFCNAINIGDALGGITTELQIFTVQILDSKAAVSFLFRPLDRKVFPLCVVYIINIAACKINITIYMEGKLAVLDIKGTEDSIRKPLFTRAERNEVAFLIVILEEGFIINSLPVFALHGDCVVFCPCVVTAHLGINRVAINCFFYHIISKALTTRGYIIKIIKGNSHLAIVLFKRCSIDRSGL